MTFRNNINFMEMDYGLPSYGGPLVWRKTVKTDSLFKEVFKRSLFDFFDTIPQ